MRRLLPFLLAFVLAGCGGGPPRIEAGTPCVRCGMAVAQLRFACEKKTDEGWQRYDSIECLLADAGDGAAYLTDYDGGALHAADSMWVVKGSFPSPMGGGFAAFATRGAADEVAAKTNGRVGRLEAFGGAR